MEAAQPRLWERTHSACWFRHSAETNFSFTRSIESVGTVSGSRINSGSPLDFLSNDSVRPCRLRKDEISGSTSKPQRQAVVREVRVRRQFCFGGVRQLVRDMSKISFAGPDARRDFERLVDA